MANEVAVCTTCHALVHAGLLRVTGRADEELHWSPVAADRGPSPDGQRSRDVEQSANADSPSESEPKNGRGASARGCGVDLEALAQGLVRLGVPVARSRRIIGSVVDGMPRDELTEASVLRGALAAI